MKKILPLLIASILISCSIYIAFADNNSQISEEAWDEDEYGPFEPIIWHKPVKTVIFQHKTHTMDAEVDCDSCHDEIFEMEAGVAEEDENFTMQAMYEGESCGACHDGDTAFAANTRCTTCHIGVRGYNRMMRGKNTEEKVEGH